MNPRATYQHLVNHNVTQDELNTFISKTTAMHTSSIEDPLYEVSSRRYFYSGLCYATEIADEKIVKALLRAGANPNLVANPGSLAHTSPLFTAAKRRKTHAAIFELMLNPTNSPKADIYLLDPHNHETLFSHSRGDTEFVRRILDLDEGLSHVKEEEKTKISMLIAHSGKPFATLDHDSLYKTLSNTIGKIYEKNEKELFHDDSKPFVKKALEEHLGYDIPRVALSYLSFFRKPLLLTHIENEVKQQSQERAASYSTGFAHTNANYTSE